ncbi:hypothetical protein Tco_0678203 [Tanacetum coccineum]|uniref:Uncharacterized protein n=1 Tax=Tanacetum coccineum TaxID=301880 RepID=A0ABQ4XEE0_9ASTR
MASPSREKGKAKALSYGSETSGCLDLNSVDITGQGRTKDTRAWCVDRQGVYKRPFALGSEVPEVAEGGSSSAERRQAEMGEHYVYICLFIVWTNYAGGVVCLRLGSFVGDTHTTGRVVLGVGLNASDVCGVFVF